MTVAPGGGELGDGTMIDRTTPVMVAGLSDAVEIAAGTRHTCARLASGSVVCWGRNADGELGDGTTVDRLAPTPVAGLVLWGEISQVAASSPTAVSGLSAAVEHSAGGRHTCACLGTGVAVCWGTNGLGALGDGTTTDRLAPVPVLLP